MDHTEKNNRERIEKYLNNKLSEKEKQEFELELSENPELKDKLEAYKNEIFINSLKKKYKDRIEEEEKQGQINRKNRLEKKRLKDLKVFETLSHLKEHSTGLINWKQKENSYIWDGFIAEQKVFKISQGIYKFTLSVYPEIKIEENKHKGLKTSFELNKLELIAESIAKKIEKRTT